MKRFIGVMAEILLIVVLATVVMWVSGMASSTWLMQAWTAVFILGLLGVMVSLSERRKL